MRLPDSVAPFLATTSADTERPPVGAMGVIHTEDENPLSLMCRAHVGRSDAVPFDTEPERGQVCEYRSHSPRRSQPGDVFQEDEAWSNHANAVCDC